jgi:signal transduction histidine kinase
MSVIALPHSLRSTKRRAGLEHLWIGLALANYAAALIWQSWEGLPFRIVWVGLVAAYGLFVLRADPVLKVVFLLGAVAGTAMLVDALHIIHLWNNPVDAPPVMAVMCLVLVWNARRHQDALRHAGVWSAEQQSLLDRQERFVHDASHELRTPLTIARGHLELLRSRSGEDPDLNVALEEMSRLDGIIEQLLLLAAVGQPDFLRLSQVELEPLLEDVFVRWVDIAPRAWRLGAIPSGRIAIDPDRIRTALDTLLENAVKYTEAHDAIELRARLGDDDVVILEVADQGQGVPAEALQRIFERFGRADPARGRAVGGVGLGLAIVDAIAKRHNGRCTVQSSSMGSVFALELPRFVPVAKPAERHVRLDASPAAGPAAPC